MRHQLLTGFLFFLTLTTGSQLLQSCTKFKTKENNPNKIDNTEISATGIKIKADTLPAPQKINAAPPEVKRVGKIESKTLITNSVLASEPKKVIITQPTVITPGIGSAAKPKVMDVITKPVFCKAPTQILVKDSYIKETNPCSFSSLSQLQGLLNDQVRSIVQDSIGNLWLATDEGLVRYDGKYFYHYRREQGLSNNLILSLFIDSKGNLWFGSFRGGVTKFDGIYLTNFNTDEGLLSDVVNVISEDSTGAIWIGTGEGVSIYDGKSFKNFTPKEGLSGKDVRTFARDNEGRIWIGTANGGFSIYDGKSFTNYSKSNGFVNNFISEIIKDRKGSMWLATASSGVVKFDGTKFFNYTTESGLSSNLMRSAYQDKNGDYWFGTADKGVSRFDGTFFYNYGVEDGLNSDFVKTILEDKQGNIWLATKVSGLTKYDGRIFSHYTEKEGLTYNRVMNILEDKKGNLWFGTYGGYATIMSKDPKSGETKISAFGKEEGLFGSRIYSIIEDKAGDIWFGSDGGGVSKYDGKNTYTYNVTHGMASNSIRVICQDSDGNYLFGTYGEGLIFFDGTTFTKYSVENGLSGANILSLLQDSKGRYWIGTDGGGITLFDGTNFTHYNKKSGFFDNTIYSFAEDKNGNIWIGTAEEGLIRYNGKTFKKFGTENGLINSTILSLKIDSDNKIYAGTRSGLNVIDYENHPDEDTTREKISVRSYGYEDGFFGISCNLDAIGIQSNGTVWVGTINRLTSFHNPKEEIKQINYTPQITNLQLFNENIPWITLNANRDTTILLSNGIRTGKLKFKTISKWYGLPLELKLSHSNSFIDIHFNIVSLSNVKGLRYEYMLKGLDKSWNISDRNELSYGNLSPGKYTFQVRSLTIDGSRSEICSYSFIILHPWWKTIWFYLSVGIIIILSIYWFIGYRERRLIKDNAILEDKVKEQTRELLVKNETLKNINLEKDKLFTIIAHDLRGPFSSFMGITQMLSDDISLFSKEDLQTFAKKMNRSATDLFNLLENLLQWSRMQQGTIQFNPENINLKQILSGNLELLKNSAEEKGITLKIDIPDNIDLNADSKMIQTIIRNLVSNAIKFTSGGGHIELKAKQEGSETVISVKDDGIGMPEETLDKIFHLNNETGRFGTAGEPSSGLGLLICKDFVEKHNGKLTAKSTVKKGSTFTVTINSVN